MLQDVLELKLKGSVDAVNNAVVLLEKSTVAALRTENEVRCMRCWKSWCCLHASLLCTELAGTDQSIES